MEKKGVSLLIGSSTYENKQLVSDTYDMTEKFIQISWAGPKLWNLVGYRMYRNKNSASQSWCLVATNHEARAVLEMKQNI